MLRVRSQVEISNSMDDLCMHVGIVGENDERGRRRSSNGGPRFEWETVISPGEREYVESTREMGGEEVSGGIISIRGCE